MVFDKPQWKWTQAEGEVEYGHVTNAILVRPERGPKRKAFANLPTELFPLLESLGYGPGKLAKSGAYFILQQSAVDQSWVLFFHAPLVGEVALWKYKAGGEPGWMSSAPLASRSVQYHTSRA